MGPVAPRGEIATPGPSVKTRGRRTAPARQHRSWCPEPLSHQARDTDNRFLANRRSNTRGQCSRGQPRARSVSLRELQGRPPSSTRFKRSNQRTAAVEDFRSLGSRVGSLLRGVSPNRTKSRVEQTVQLGHPRSDGHGIFLPRPGRAIRALKTTLTIPDAIHRGHALTKCMRKFPPLDCPSRGVVEEAALEGPIRMRR